MKIIGLIGSNSKNSTNRKLLQYIQKHFADKAELELVEISDLPMFDKPADKNLPEVVTEMAGKIEAADGVIVATPEYDHAIPAALMNAFAWLSYGIFPVLNKPLMITGASYGTLGSSRAQLQLRQILDAPELKANVMPGSEFLLPHSLQAFDAEGNLQDLESIQKLEVLFDDFRLFVKMSEKLSGVQDLLHEEAENFNWESLEGGEYK